MSGRGRLYVLQSLTFLLLAACPAAPPARSGILLDLQQMPQSVGAYLEPGSAQDRLLWSDQPARGVDYLSRHFAPWEKEAWLRPASEVFWILPWLKGNRLFGEDRQPLAADQVSELIRQAAPESYPSLDRRAITLRPVDFRTLPSRRPGFRDPDRPGEGYPFDYLQNSGAPACTPLRVRHLSLDGGWVYAEAPGVFGWLPVDDIAWVDDGFIARFRAGVPVVLVRDRDPVVDQTEVFRFYGRIGTFLPLVQVLPDGYEVWLAAADPARQAVLRRALLPAEAAALFPVPATSARLAEIADRFLGQPYGWGDLNGNRDCTATLRDLFAPFGVWLPRNSARQPETGHPVRLDTLPPEEKERVILRSGVPLRTLVWMDGHVMLYLGEYRGRAAVLHALWGLRTRDGKGIEGRRIVGRTVITSLQPGWELAELARPEGDLRHRIKGMTLLGGSPAEAGRTGGKR